MRAPVAVAMRPARARPRSRTPCPVRKSMAGSPEPRAFAQRATACALTFARSGAEAVAATPGAAFHAVSAGRMRVAICPGGVEAAVMAAAPSSLTVAALAEVRTHAETGR